MRQKEGEAVTLRERAEAIWFDSARMLGEEATVPVFERHLREAVAEAIEEATGYLKNKKDRDMFRARAAAIREGREP